MQSGEGLRASLVVAQSRFLLVPGVRYVALYLHCVFFWAYQCAVLHDLLPPPRLTRATIAASGPRYWFCWNPRLNLGTLAVGS